MPSKDEIVSFALQKQVLISPEVLKELEDLEDYKTIVEYAFKEKTDLLKQEALENILKKIKSKVEEEKTKRQEEIEEVVVLRQKRLSLRDEFSPKIRVVRNYSLENDKSEGSVEDFLQFFRDKYETLSSFLKKKPSISSLTTITSIKNSIRGKEASFIGMVREKRETKTNNVLLTVEDEEDEIKVAFSKNNRELIEKAKRILEDDVLAFKGITMGKDFFVATDFEWPDVTIRKETREEREDLYMAIISDIHIGSDKFLKEQFEKMLEWIKNSEEGRKIKYLIFAGDLVDGVGIYPNQLEDLTIKDIYDQYKVFEEYLLSLPDGMEIVVIPGNHDAVRRADPQPPLTKEFFPETYDLKNIHFLSSPSSVEIEGLNVLIYHGTSLNDIYSSLFGLSMDKPEEIMKEQMLRRDLMPVYGKGNPLYPSKRDYMLIREEPDIFVSGHVHHNGHLYYKGRLILNSGCWQSQTEYELKQGLYPTPGRLSLVNLKDLSYKEVVFYEG